MGRKVRGKAFWFIVRDYTPSEAEGDTGKYGEGKMYWAGLHSGDKFYSYKACGHGFEWRYEADEAAIKLVLAYPDLLGKLDLSWEFIPESDYERKKRMKEARERRKADKKRYEAWKAANAGSLPVPDSSGTPPSTTKSSTEPA